MRHPTPGNLQYLNNFVFVRQSKTRKLRSACQTSCLTVAAAKYTETGRELHLKHKKFDMTSNILYTVTAFFEWFRIYFKCSVTEIVSITFGLFFAVFFAPFKQNPGAFRIYCCFISSVFIIIRWENIWTVKILSILLTTWTPCLKKTWLCPQRKIRCLRISFEEYRPTL